MSVLFLIKNRVLYTKFYQESTKVGLVNGGGMGKGTDTWNWKPKNIYNGDETGLFFRLPPNRTLCLKGDICKGRKNCKEQLTVLLACSAKRTDKLLPLITGMSETVIDFKMSLRCTQNMYPAGKTMVTQAVFTDCFQNEFPEQKDITFHRPLCCWSTAETKECKLCVFYPHACTNIFHFFWVGIISHSNVNAASNS